MFQYIIQRAGWNINIGFTSNGVRSDLERMLELPMTPAHACLKPTIVLKQFDNLSDFHARSLNRISAKFNTNVRSIQ